MREFTFKEYSEQRERIANDERYPQQVKMWMFDELRKTFEEINGVSIFEHMASIDVRKNDNPA